MGFRVYHDAFEFTSAIGTSTAQNIGTTVDLDHSFLLFYTAGSGTPNLPTEGSCTGYLSSTTQMTFDRITGVDAFWVSWFVVECTRNEFTVRGRGSIVLAATVTSNTASVSDVSDTGQCIIVYGGHKGEGASTNDWEDCFCNVHLTASDTVTAKRDAGSDGTQVTIRYEVVEWLSDYTIYTGETTVNSSEVTALISGGGNPDDPTVDMNRSFMIANWYTPVNGIQQVQNYYYISDTNEVTIGAYSGTYNNLVRWYVIEFPSDKPCVVQRFSYNWNPTTAPNNVRTDNMWPVNTGRSFIIMTCSCSGTGTAFRRDFNLPRLVSNTEWSETQYNPTTGTFDQHETRASIIQLPTELLGTIRGY